MQSTHRLLIQIRIFDSQDAVGANRLLLCKYNVCARYEYVRIRYMETHSLATRQNP